MDCLLHWPMPIILVIRATTTWRRVTQRDTWLLGSIADSRIGPPRAQTISSRRVDSAVRYAGGLEIGAAGRRRSTRFGVTTAMGKAFVCIE